MNTMYDVDEQLSIYQNIQFFFLLIWNDYSGGGGETP